MVTTEIADFFFLQINIRARSAKHDQNLNTLGFVPFSQMPLG